MHARVRASSYVSLLIEPGSRKAWPAQAQSHLSELERSHHHQADIQATMSRVGIRVNMVRLLYS